MFIKICGITRKADFEAVISSGASAAGFIGWAGSARFIKAEKIPEMSIGVKIPVGFRKVGVFVNASRSEIFSYIEHGIDTVQLHGGEDEDFALKLKGSAEIWKAVRPRDKDEILQYMDYPADKFLIDTFSKTEKGGTGKTCDWELARFAVEKLPAPVILAGGLNVNNIAEALSRVCPDGIDVSSGVEISPGIKDPLLIENLMKELKKYV